jgi:hypothetical protein
MLRLTDDEPVELPFAYDDAVADAKRHEDEAAAQVREWGFNGIGSLPFGKRP